MACESKLQCKGLTLMLGGSRVEQAAEYCEQLVVQQDVADSDESGPPEDMS